LAGKALSHSNEGWLKRALGTERKRDWSTVKFTKKMPDQQANDLRISNAGTARLKVSHAQILCPQAVDSLALRAKMSQSYPRTVVN